MSSESSTAEFKIFGLNMLHQVVIALVLGVAVGYFMGEGAEQFKILGTLFLKLIMMVVSPLIFLALVSGITSLTEAHHFKGIAMKGTAAYLFTSVVAVSCGLLLGTIFEPGIGVPLPPVSDTTIGTARALPPSVPEFLMAMIPKNIVHALAENMYLQIVFFAIFTGIVMNNISGSTKKVKDLNQELAHIIFKMIEWIVRTAPVAVFGFIAAMVGTTGMEAITSLLSLVVMLIGACFVQYIVYGLMVLFFGRLNPIPFYKKMVTTQIVAFSTSSSKATLTTAMRELQDKIGVSQSSSNFMMPLGACINMDGTAIYLGMCAMFFAQMYGVQLEGSDYIMLMIACTFGSIGAAGVPSGSILFMAMVLGSVGIPTEAIPLLLGVDRILDMFRTTVNITSDAAITVIIDNTEGQLDKEQYFANT